MKGMKSDLELLKQAGKDLDWIYRNYEDLEEKYEKKVIAVQGEKVVAFAENGDLLLKKLEGLGIDDGEVMVKFIPKKDSIVVYTPFPM